MSSFRQWMQTNVDYKQQEEMYDLTDENITWNPVSPYDLAPAYWDNPYFQRYKNYETDKRDRLMGYLMAEWKITGYLSLMGRVSVDTYEELQEERKEVGSASGEFGVGRPDVTSGYSRFSKNFMETNLDFMLNFYKNIGENFNLKAMAGTNIRRTRIDQVFASTEGGLIVPGLFALSNSANQMVAPEERYTMVGVNGMFASVSLGYKDFLFLDGNLRLDQSSTLPEDENTYPYGGVSGSFLFSNLLTLDWMQLGKLRLSWAKVGNDAPWGSIKDTYIFDGTFSGTAMYSLPNNKANEKLVPEISNTLEGGLEMKFFMNRLGFDLALYKENTINQILPVSVSTATGYSGKYLNAGEVENKGVELSIFGKPIKSSDFEWEIALNFARNVSEVIELDSGISNLTIARLQGGVSINARVGEPYGTIQGTDYVYNEDGQKVVGSNGYYLKTATSDIVLGDINPDFILGLNNRFNYKNWALSFLIDWQQGGSVFSLDLYYGLGTGLYEETDFINDLGNPVRNPLTDDETSGGLILDGVVNVGTAEEPIWEENTKRVAGDDYRVFGWSRNPNSTFVYDATYVKLREVVLSYSIPSKVMEKSFIKGATFSLVGSNLWIISKDLPHADPEASQSSGNVQGWQSGVMPSTRNIGLTVNLQF
jgi:outer membrane receptor protein involved in Fe transport